MTFKEHAEMFGARPPLWVCDDCGKETAEPEFAAGVCTNSFIDGPYATLDIRCPECQAKAEEKTDE